MQFIDTIAHHLIHQETDNLEDICLLVPGKRAGVYLHQSLMQQLDKPAWAPKIMTINELFLSLTDKEKADPLQLIYELFLVFRTIKKSNENFNQFYYWGEIMLNDFEDIDKYRVNASQLFSNIKDIKAIENHFDYLTTEQIRAIQQFWEHFNESKASQQKQDFIAIWDVLGSIYHTYRKSLQDRNLCYEGMAFREIADQADQQALTIPYRKVYCIGFNILNECEHALFKHLKHTEQGVFFWDYDPYYLKEVHEAGRFIQQNISRYPPPAHPDIYQHWKSPSPEKQKKIHSISCLTQVSQAKMIPHLLHQFQISQSSEYEKTAIILCDEKLLIPVIQSLPEGIDYNITMGFPFEQTPLYSFLQTFFELHRSTQQKQANQFYYKNALSILSHQYIMSVDKETCEAVTQYIHEHNLVYFDSSAIGDSPILQLIFKQPDHHIALLRQIQSLLKLLYKNQHTLQDSGMDQEYLYMQYKKMNRFISIAEKINALSPLDLSTLQQLFFTCMASLRIPFTGDPLQGMQIMGLLETRGLDFDNVLILSANEGHIPKTTTSPSFIPYNLRKGFNLQTIEYQDSIYAYYFYRLLQRSQHIGITYAAESKSLGSSEKSRFLTQLQYDPDSKLIHQQQTYDINPSIQQEIIQEKTAVVVAKLWEYIENQGISASALISYMNCPLQFFFHYLAGLRETEEVKEEIDAARTGTIIHETMEKLYADKHDFIREDLTAIIANKAHIQATIRKQYKHAYQIKEKDTQISGSNLLSLSIIENAVLQILLYDQGIAPFKMLSLEKEVRFTRMHTLQEKEIKISYKGIIDRIDIHKGILRVIDYKTGNASNSFKSLDQLFCSDNTKRKNAIFQLLFYTLPLAEEYPQEHILPAIYSLKELQKENFNPFIRQDKTLVSLSGIRASYYEWLDQTTQEIISPEIPFTQTDHEDNCVYCPYRIICNR